MKKILNLTLIIASFLTIFSCSEEDLNTSSTQEASGATVFKSANDAYVALNGIYRMTYLSGWTASNTHQNFGIMSTNLYADLMGEDMVQHEQGNGWFWYDYGYQVRSRYTSTSWRPYASWNFYYTLISNVNYILAAVSESTSGSKADVNNVLGQAHAIRAYCYFYLIQSFQKTYIGHENSPGVPLYTEPTSAETEGKPRGTVQQVYDLINADIDKAIVLLKDATPQMHKSHIDYYVANAIKARIALVQDRWADAEVCAKEALLKPSLSLAGSEDVLTGFNSISMKGVMWGAEVIEDQATTYASFYAHMDASTDMYANGSRKCISNWLYAQIPITDARRQWWNGVVTNEESTGVNCSYNQFKYRWRTAGSYASDYIYMRAEEMVLTVAEALCRQGKYGEARTYISQLGDKRDSNYATRLAKVSDSKEQTFSSEGVVTTLLDEILVQRRIELWCEIGRIFDVMRLKQGFYRDWNGSNHTNKLSTLNTRNPELNDVVLTIPQAEFDGNTNMDVKKDQNP